MYIGEIQDEKSLGDWLQENGSKKAAVVVATRAAMRVQPSLWSGLSPAWRADARTPLHFVRALLTAAYASQHSTFESLTAATRASVTATNVSLGEIVSDPHAEAAQEAVLSASQQILIEAMGPAKRAVFEAQVSVDSETLDYGGELTPRNSELSPPSPLETEFWECLHSDCRVLQYSQSAWVLPLWSSSNSFDEKWRRVLEAWHEAGAPWNTFARIYDDFWHGREPDCDYLEKIVLIDPEIWEAGPEAVAEAIQIIDEQQRLAALAKEQLENLRRIRGSRRSSGSPGLGHNNPPESLSDEASREVLEAGASAGRALEDLAKELKRTDPSSERLDESSNRLLKALSIVAKYCGQKLDLAVDTLIKWGIPVGGAWLVANYTELSALANGAKALVKLIGG